MSTTNMIASRYLLLLAFLWIGACSQPEKPSSVAADNINVAIEDPFLWLEDIDGERAINWVKKHNKRSLDVLENQPLFESLYEANKTILNAEDRIAYASQMGGYLYNFWRDKDHVRGIYRRTTLDSYKTNNPQWDTILDIDDLAVKDDENWVYKGMNCRQPEYDRCLVNLSRGGADAKVVREFDLNSQTFVTDGFTLREAKNGLSWIDKNQVLVGTDFGADSMADSGYPKTVKLWQRGTDITDAKHVFTGESSDAGVWPATFYDNNQRYLMITQANSFYTSNSFLLDVNFQPKKLDIPHDASISGLIDGNLLIELKSDWNRLESVFKQGSLITANL